MYLDLNDDYFLNLKGSNLAIAVGFSIDELTADIGTIYAETTNRFYDTNNQYPDNPID